MFDGRQQIVNSKILVIDDEQIIIDVITAHLNVAGFWNVVGISDSIDAVQRMKQENPDLVLLDISMPDVSGNYLIQIARADPNLNSVPLIVVTASDSEDIHRRALELGADEVLTKPLQPGVLVKRVEHALSRKLESDVSSLNQRQERCRPVNEKYNELRGLGGRII
ncbi:Alkaline phosphatase synthesis transcriptional regulatory protein PhoP [Stieleria maiorica]|uniref:Alkaline phosphatase synthesis transcriptional regulatory protein PhoP n=1 Tax=Stieleria maiorica TaxID=2795974 RepID=A0A5B9M5I5_9BACT|nr:response regulator [Stieleria maiorica]QEF96059.1 Alkaline phosphatase synthesis transcriptional regulatory protein PhoP [Stieleria maiorica]